MCNRKEEGGLVIRKLNLTLQLYWNWEVTSISACDFLFDLNKYLVWLNLSFFKPYGTEQAGDLIFAKNFQYSVQNLL